MDRLSRWLVYTVVASIPVLFGAVQIWVWSAYAAIIWAIYLFCMWRGTAKAAALPSLFSTNRCLLVFFLWAFLQIVPLPLFAYRILVPHHVDQLMFYAQMFDDPVAENSISLFPLPSAARLAFLFSLFLFYRTFRTYFHPQKYLRRIVLILICVGTLEALYGLVQTLVPAVGVLWVDSSLAYFGKARGTFINKNHFAGFLEMVFPITLGYAMAISYWPLKGNLKRMLASDNINKAFFFLILLTVMLVSIFFSQSRAGFLALLCGLAAFAGIVRRAERRPNKTLLAMLGFVIVFFFIYGYVIGFQPVVDRFLAIGTDVSRIDIWRDAWRIVKDFPLGIGLGNFEDVFVVYQETANHNHRFVHAHNDYLQLLVETGWPGFLALMSGFLYFMASRFQKITAINPGKDPVRFFTAAGAVTGLIAIGVHSFFDFNLQIPANCFYFVLLMAMVDTAADNRRPAGAHSP